MSNLTVTEVEVILRETSEVIREKLQPLADAGFNDFDVRIYLHHIIGSRSPLINVEVAAKLNNLDWR